jgi:hypothetical protein
MPLSLCGPRRRLRCQGNASFSGLWSVPLSARFTCLRISPAKIDENKLMRTTDLMRNQMTPARQMTGLIAFLKEQNAIGEDKSSAVPSSLILA